MGAIAMNSHVSMTTFVEVTRAGSFAAAARNLNMSTTAVSRHVADLERMLGVTLLRRTTRRLSPTEAGARYLPRAVAILDEIERLNAEISAVDATPRGKLKITAPPAVGNEVIAPLAVDFIEAYPEIELEIELTERLVDLVAEGFDAAIRAGPLESSSMIAHRIVEMRYLICASPSYLARRGVPKRPDEIGEHDCIYWRAASESRAWNLVKDGARVPVPIRGRLLMSNFAAGREAAVRGLGLAILPVLTVRDDLEAGRLIPVLPDYQAYHGILSLVRPPTPFEPPKLRAFIDFITPALRERARYDPRRYERPQATVASPRAPEGAVLDNAAPVGPGPWARTDPGRGRRGPAGARSKNA
jgi:DNA-binding transcriptional LysR family regulator